MRRKTKKALKCLFTVYASVPIILYLFPWILGHIIFSHFVRIPFWVDLSKPEEVLKHTCNFYLNPEEGISVGVWHTLPANQWEAAAGKNPEWYRETLGDGNPVIIHLHGNGGNRAFFHRLELAKVLSAGGYHVLTLDYRGYGDSTGEPSETGLTTDALYLYNWVKNRSSGSLVCLWGHSLGSGVATNTAMKVQEQGSVVDAVVLTGPFTKIGEVVLSHPLAKMYRFLPGFDYLVWNILERNNILFANDKNLEIITSPLLILHAEDDNIVPYHMGQKLYHISHRAQKLRNKADHVQMKSYNADLGYRHDKFYLDPDLPNLVGRFLQNLKQQK